MNFFFFEKKFRFHTFTPGNSCMNLLDFATIVNNDCIEFNQRCMQSTASLYFNLTGEESQNNPTDFIGKEFSIHDALFSHQNPSNVVMSCAICLIWVAAVTSIKHFWRASSLQFTRALEIGASVEVTHFLWIFHILMLVSKIGHLFWTVFLLASNINNIQKNIFEFDRLGIIVIRQEIYTGGGWVSRISPLTLLMYGF